jgi:cytochrome c553
MQILKFAIAVCGVATFVSTDVVADQRGDFFEKKIRPQLAAHCYECHGPKKQESDLRVDHISFLKAEGNYGDILVPGEPNKSNLYISLTHENEDIAMPYERKQLPPAVIADFKKWIDDGAYWPQEPSPTDAAQKFDLAARKERLPWIWKTPTKQTAPVTKDKTWAKTEIDQFILSQLESNSLAPAPDAEPEVWLRRVHFAITGLPPTVEQINQFLANPNREQREEVVDRLLNSQHFGERWTRHWMDLVRYAESRGHESDFPIANGWHYRDYLIRAFNQDLPYDQFVTEHIAGDLLPTPRVNTNTGINESVLATAWPFFGEEVHSPVDIRQDECERVDNKVDVFSKTFLGLAVACARCHDHKFDAIAQMDYYSLAGIVLSSRFRQVRFESMQENGIVADQLDKLWRSTQLELRNEVASSYEQQTPMAMKYLRAALGQLDGQKIDDSQGLGEQEVAAWVVAIRAAAADSNSPLRVLYTQPTGLSPKPNTPPVTPSDESSRVIVDYSDPQHQWMTSGYAFGRAAKRTGDIALELDGPLQVLQQGVAERDPIWNSLRLSPKNGKDSGSLDAVGRSAGLLATPTFLIEAGKIRVLMKGQSRVYASVDSHLMITGPLHKGLMVTLNAPKQQWVTLSLAAYRGHRVHLEFGPVGASPLAIWKVVDGSLPAESSETKLAELLKDREQAITKFQKHFQKLLTAFKSGAAVDKTARRQPAAERQWILNNSSLFEIAKASATKRQAIVAKFREQRMELAKRIKTDSRTAIAWMDGSGVDENVLIRGKYQRIGESAPRRLPSAFPQSKSIDDQGSGRLQLAKQMVDPNNPLVARVMVNRIWHHLMGRGIVGSVDNFGWLGQRPTHPQLLDNLAHQFVHVDKWSMKQMIKRILLTRTYAMSSRPDDEQAEDLDPKNLLLHRMPIRRLEGEVIRDSILAVSGRLDPKLHGPPIPVHLTEFVVGRGRPGSSGPLDGAGRRSIYTSVRRNFLPTMMLTFDTPIPFSTVGRRNVTNVPAQTLAMMNDKFILEQAKLWAARINRELPVATSKQRVERMYWEALGRQAKPGEIQAALATIDLLAEYHKVESEHTLVWSDLCHTFFRVNEFIYLR